MGSFDSDHEPHTQKRYPLGCVSKERPFDKQASTKRVPGLAGPPTSRLRWPTFELEAAELQLGFGPIAGVDEAGRGPWAGPVVAAAVILRPECIPHGLNDSKVMDSQARDVAFDQIMACAEVGIGIADVARIDRDNILQATLYAMTQAISSLPQTPGLVLVDGNRLPQLTCPARAIVKGDAKCVSIAAASIIAKVTRDRLMIALSRLHPGYGFERHKGYGVPEHKVALAKLGVSPHHRRTFKPIQLLLGLELA